MSGDRGSVFVEALVTVAVVAAATGAMVLTTAQAAARRHQIEDRRTALLIARSEMAAVGTAIPVQPGDVEGAEGDFAWRVVIEPAAQDAAVASLAGSPARVTVTVRSAAGGPDLATLASLRLEAP